MTNKLPFHTFLACISLFVMSCKGQEQTRQITKPEQLNDGWEISTPDDVKMDETLLAEAVEKNRLNKGVDGFVVVRNGKLIVDEYYNGYNAKKPHKVWSVTKSITSAIMGIAIEKGAIQSVNDSISRYMGPYVQAMSNDKNTITIRHLLTMTSGIDWVELGGRQSAGFRVAYSPDWIEFVLTQPMSDTPGRRFNYSSGDYMLLAPIIKNATGMQADAYAEQHLFSPMQITSYEWIKGSEFWTKMEGGELPGARKPEPPIEYPEYFAGYPATASGLKMLPRDMAKVGQLYLDNGKWNGKQIIPADWIMQSVQPHFGNTGYGYGWRLTQYIVGDKEIDCYYATGFGLQSIYVFPELDLVTVFTQQNYRTMQEGERQTQDVLQNYVLKAVQ